MDRILAKGVVGYMDRIRLGVDHDAIHDQCHMNPVARDLPPGPEGIPD
jgi:hypothetical protein